MKVLYLHQHFVTPRGAGGTRSYEMAQRLIERGHSVTMVCGSINGGHGAVTGLSGAFTRGVRKGLVDGIWVIELELPYSNADSFARRSFTFLKFSIRSMLLVFSERYDLLFATSTPLTVAIPALAGKWIRRRPMVFEVRDLWPELPRAMGVISNPIVLRSLELLEKAAYRSASSIIALSPGMAHGIGRVVGVRIGSAAVDLDG